MQKGSTMIKFQIWGGMIRDNFLKALKMVLRDKQEFYYWKKKVGVGGEIRSAFRADQRIAEAKKLGFKHAIAPATIRDKFVTPVKDLRETLIKYVK